MNMIIIIKINKYNNKCNCSIVESKKLISISVLGRFQQQQVIREAHMHTRLPHAKCLPNAACDRGFCLGIIQGFIYLIYLDINDFDLWILICLLSDPNAPTGPFPFPPDAV